MLIADKIKEVVRNTPEGVILTIADFGIDPEYQQALVMSLSRMVRSGELEKVSKGKYYKPRNSIFGTLGPSQNEIAKDFLVKGGETIGYITGTSAFSAMGLTTQISSSLLIGTSKYRRSVKRGKTVISFLVQPNPITEENIPFLRILDAVKLIREIPATTPDDAVSQIGRIIVNLSPSEQKDLVSLSKGYTPYVRAILGAILEYNAADADIISQVRKSLEWNYKLQTPDIGIRLADEKKMEYHMRLHENKELFADAVQAASRSIEEGGLGIRDIFIEKDYWICRSLRLMALADTNGLAVHKGGTSLSKAYGIGARFSEDIDIAILDADKMSGNKLKTLIGHLSKEMSKGLEEIVIPGATSKGSHYRKEYFAYPRAVETEQVGAIRSGQLLLEINAFANPFPYSSCTIRSFLTEFLEFYKIMASFMIE